MACNPHVLVACAAVFCITVFLVMPAAAVNTAIYGSAAGFDPSLHKDTFTVTCTLTGNDGAELDKALTCFTNASTDVIFIGGDAGFSQDSGAKIAAAVKTGKILVVSGKDLSRFADILPVKDSGNTAEESPTLEIADSSSTLSQDIFAGLSSPFPNATKLSTRESYTKRSNATTLLSFENGDPALAFIQYGNGYVAAWLPPADTAYLDSTTADTISERLITHLMAMRVTTVATTAAVTTAPVAVNTTAEATTEPTAGESLGNVSVYSSPLSANVYIDGVYKGIAPVNLTGISAGSHSLKLALTDYYDYDTTITVVGGGTITAFGSLAPRESAATATATATPTAAVTDATSSIWSSPAVVAAVLGIITAIIGAIVTLFTLYHKHK